MDKNNVLDVSKYVMLLIVIMIMLKYLPNQSMSNNEIIVLSVVLVLSYLLTDNIVTIYEQPKSEAFCSALCGIEKMTNITNTPQTIPIIQTQPIIQETVKNETITSENKYTNILEEPNVYIPTDKDYVNYNQLPMADNYNASNDFEYGYSFLPPEKWYPEPSTPPICLTEKRSPITPSYTTGIPLDAKVWNSKK